MNAVEFSGKIEKGKIIIPKQYLEFDNENVIIIMLIDESKKKHQKKKIF